MGDRQLKADAQNTVVPQLPHSGRGCLAKQSTPSFLADFLLTELPETRALKPLFASEDRNLRLFTMKIKSILRPSLAYLYAEVSG